MLGLAMEVEELAGAATGFGGAGAAELAEGAADAELGGHVGVVGVGRAKLEENAGGVFFVLGGAVGDEVDEEGEGADMADFGVAVGVGGEDGERGERFVDDALLVVDEEVDEGRDNAGAHGERFVVVADGEVEDGAGGVALAAGGAVDEELDERGNGVGGAPDEGSPGGGLGRKAEQGGGGVLSGLGVAVLEDCHDVVQRACRHDVVLHGRVDGQVEQQRHGVLLGLRVGAVAQDRHDRRNSA